MTPEDADKAQQWAGMDGATAWHLINRHAESWNEVGELMNAWLRANGGGSAAQPLRKEAAMDNQNYVILKNTRNTDAHKAAHDLNDKVTSLKTAVIRLIEIYEEAERETECGGDQGAMLLEHRTVIAAARSLVTPSSAAHDREGKQ
jgi:hypothetical protein